MAAFELKLVRCQLKRSYTLTDKPYFLSGRIKSALPWYRIDKLESSKNSCHLTIQLSWTRKWFMEKYLEIYVFQGDLYLQQSKILK